MYCFPETTYELVLRAQQELRADAAKAQLLARVRRESSSPRPRWSGPFTLGVRRKPTTLVRP